MANRIAMAYGWEDAHTFMRENDSETWAAALASDPSEALVNALTINKVADLFEVDPEAPEYSGALADYASEWRRALEKGIAAE